MSKPLRFVRLGYIPNLSFLGYVEVRKKEVLRVGGWVGGGWRVGGSWSRIMPRCGSILQAETCQILSLAVSLCQCEIMVLDSSLNLLYYIVCCIPLTHTLFPIASCVVSGLPAVEPAIVSQQVPNLPKLISREADSNRKFE